jgi:PIN domain nuclease of toxin-antitoxin system
LDTSALVAVIRGEPGAERVREWLDMGRCTMHAANVSELCFSAPKRVPECFTPASAMAWFIAEDIAISNVLDLDFLQLAAEIRLVARPLSLGDGMAIALASISNLPIVTAEHAFKKAREYVEVAMIR